MKQIGLALHNYHDDYGCFPPAYIANEAGEPLHSWRVLILPYLGDEAETLHAWYDFSVPWDHPRNDFVLRHMPALFNCDDDPDRGGNVTTYSAPFGPNCVFRGSEPARIRDITDGTSNTILVGETRGLNVPWTKPQDVDVTVPRRIGDARWFGGHGEGQHDGGMANFLLGDGSVRGIANDIPEEWLQNLFERNDGNVIPEF